MEKKRWTSKDFTGGLNLDIAEDLLNPAYSPDLLNVQVLDKGVIGRVSGSFKKYSQTSKIKRLGYFVLSNNKKYILFQEDDYTVKVMDPIDFVVLDTLHTFSDYVSFAQAYNYIFFGNRIDGIYRWNGNEVVYGGAPEKPVFVGLTSGWVQGWLSPYRYKVTFVIDGIETGAGEYEEVSFGGGYRGVILDIPIGPTGTTARKIYRKNYHPSSPYKLVGTVSDNTTTSFTDTPFIPYSDQLEEGFNPLIAGDFIEFWDTRLWVGRTNESATSVFMSDEGYPNRMSADNYIDVGDVITGMKAFKNQLIIFTEKKVLVVIKDTTGAYGIAPLLDSAGAFENSMAIVQGVLYWVNQQGIWAYSGSSLSLVSEGSASKVAVEKAGFIGSGLRDIKIQTGTTREWNVTTQADWNDYDTITDISTADVPGSITLEHYMDNTPVIDSMDDYNGYLGTSGGKLGQTFVPPNDMWLSLIKIFMFKEGTPGVDCEVSIYTDNSGVPGDLLGTVTVPEDDIQTAGTNVTFDFTSQRIGLVGGDTYWIVMEQAGPDSSNEYRWVKSWSDQCAGQGYTESSGTWSPIGSSGEDFYFKLYREKYNISGTWVKTYTFNGDIKGDLKFYISYATDDTCSVNAYYSKSTDGGITWTPYVSVSSGGTIDGSNLNDGDKLKIQLLLLGNGDGTPVVDSFRVIFAYEGDEGGDVIRAGDVNGKYWLSIYKGADNYFTLCRDFYGRWYKTDRFYDDYLNLGNRITIGVDNLTDSSNSVIVKLQDGKGWIDDGSVNVEEITSYFYTAKLDMGLPDNEKNFRTAFLHIQGDGTGDAFVEIQFTTEQAQDYYRVLLPLTDSVEAHKISLPQWLVGRRLQIRIASDYYWELHGISVDFMIHRIRHKAPTKHFYKWILDTEGDFNGYIEENNTIILPTGRLELKASFDTQEMGISTYNTHAQVGTIGNVLLYINTAGILVLYHLNTGEEEWYPFEKLKQMSGITYIDTYGLFPNYPAAISVDKKKQTVYIAFNVYKEETQTLTNAWIFAYNKYGFTLRAILGQTGYHRFVAFPIEGGAFYIEDNMAIRKYIYSEKWGLVNITDEEFSPFTEERSFYHDDFLYVFTSDSSNYYKLYKRDGSFNLLYGGENEQGGLSLFEYNGDVYAVHIWSKSGQNKTWIRIMKYRGDLSTMETIIDTTYDYYVPIYGEKLMPLQFGDKILLVGYETVITFYPELNTIMLDSLNNSIDIWRTLSPNKVPDSAYWVGQIDNDIVKFVLNYDSGYAIYDMGSARNLKRLDWEGDGDVRFTFSNDGGATWSSEYTEHRENISNLTNPTNNNFQIKITLNTPTLGEPSPYVDKVTVHYYKP